MSEALPVSSSDESKIQQVYTAALDILKNTPDGLRFVDLIKRVRSRGIDFSALAQYIQWLPRRNPETFYKPSRGIFALTEGLGTNQKPLEPITADHLHSDAALQVREQAFYQSFSEYLVNDLDECTKAVPLGGNAFGGKWGTPDVMGVTQSRPRDLYKAPLELVSAEIKIVGGKELITAFGQACSYQLFSHKTYIVVPDSSKDAEIERLEALCQSFGIGLVVFNATNTAAPDYRIRVRALRREPDRFYINETLTHEFFDGLLGFDNALT